MPHIIKKGKKMEVDNTVVTVVTLAATGAIGWLKNGLNKVTDRQTGLELKVSEKHLSKADTEKMIELMNAPTIQNLNQLNAAFEKIDGKIDRLLDRKEGE